MLVTIWSKVIQKEDQWKIIIYLSGPLKDETDTIDHSNRKIKFIYMIPKPVTQTRIQMLQYADNIEHFYTTLCDGHPERFKQLFEYTFNHNRGVTENSVWLYPHIYWGSGETGRVREFRCWETLAEIMIQTDYEDISDVTWNITSSSSANTSASSNR